MHKLLTGILVVIITLFSFTVHAESLPKKLEQGFEAYEKNGAPAAIKAWRKGSSLEEGAVEGAIGLLQQIEGYFGEYQGRDIFKINELGPKSNVYLIIMNYEKGALYAKFFSYKTVKGDVLIQGYNFSTEVDEVWPRCLVYGD